MAKKKHYKKHTVKRHTSRRTSGDFLGASLAEVKRVKPAHEIASFLLLLFGAVGSSFLTKKFGDKVPEKMRPLIPAAIGLGAQLAFPKYPRIITPIKYGCYAVAGVSAAKTYLPQIPLLSGDVNDLSAAGDSSMLGVDTSGRLVDMRDNTLLVDEKGRTLNGEGAPHAENFDGGQAGGFGEDMFGDMYGDEMEGDDLEGDDFL